MEVDFVMALENELLEMQDKARQMARYYFKGFGSIIEGILSNAEADIVYTERENYSTNSYELLKKIEDFYLRIPFGDFHSKEEFYPLFVVKRLLPELRQALDCVVRERTEEELRILDTLAKSIVVVGRLYDDSFRELVSQIRMYSDGKDFHIQLVDYKGLTWNF